MQSSATSPKRARGSTLPTRTSAGSPWSASEPSKGSFMSRRIWTRCASSRPGRQRGSLHAGVRVEAPAWLRPVDLLGRRHQGGALAEVARAGRTLRVSASPVKSSWFAGSSPRPRRRSSAPQYAKYGVLPPGATVPSIAVNTSRPKKKGRPQSKYSVLAVLPLGPHKSPKAKSSGFVNSVSASPT
jgi:hypothetical protein